MSPCLGGDPLCPCQDGDCCHYRGNDPWPVRNNRRNPVEFSCLQEAREYSQAHMVKVWAKVWSWTGIFGIYPGGREIHRNS